MQSSLTNTRLSHCPSLPPTYYHQMLQYFLNPPKDFASHHQITSVCSPCFSPSQCHRALHHISLQHALNSAGPSHCAFSSPVSRVTPLLVNHHQTWQTLLWPLCTVVFPCTQALAFMAIWEAGKIQNSQGRQQRITKSRELKGEGGMQIEKYERRKEERSGKEKKGEIDKGFYLAINCPELN